jgi:malonate-semialdehyde dehydrogenase (acetylating)/methylmalonate-semialdehyde dehydrogenase
MPQIRSLSSKAVPTTKLFINGEFIESQSKDWIDLCNPATNEVISRVPNATKGEMEEAVQAAKEAFKTWSTTSIMHRQELMFNFREIMKANRDKLKEVITREEGKTWGNAEKEVFRGLRK